MALCAVAVQVLMPRVLYALHVSMSYMYVYVQIWNVRTGRCEVTLSGVCVTAVHVTAIYITTFKI
jgi:hypothetical protein